MKYLYYTVGTLSLLSGLIGVVLPLLPTTPFILLAAFCFAKSNQKIHDKITSSKLYNDYVDNFLRHKGYTVNQKVKLLINLYFVVGLSVYFMPIFLIKVGLLLMVIGQTVFLIYFVNTIHINEGVQSHVYGRK